ncbi:UNVERIFIED_ORG: hypothetical protein ABIC54_006397 [Burkholderia sp. 1263]
MSPREWFAKLARDGVLIQDEILARPDFEEFDRAARCCWQQMTGWRTRVKGPGAARDIELQDPTAMGRIGALLDAHETANPGEFTYLYSSLHQSRDQSGTVRKIGHALIGAWHGSVGELLAPPFDTNFSLTAYTPHCRLAQHTDFSLGTSPYRLTLLLFFCNTDAGLAPLHFEFKGKRQVIRAVPNRSVLFVPSPATNHWIEPVVSTDPGVLRLAFSGWLL